MRVTTTILAALALLSPIAAIAQTATFAPGFTPDPYSVRAATAGLTDASSLYGASCMGQIDPAAPALTFNVSSAIPSLSIWATATQAGDDTTIVVVGPNVLLCNDDSSGLNPQVTGGFGPGEYRVWVGAYNGGQIPFVLSLGTGGAAPTPQVVIPTTDPATYLENGFQPDPYTSFGRSGGTVDASPYGQTSYGPCRGSIPSEPQHEFELTEAFSFLRFAATAASDTTMVIEGPVGRRCNDDGSRFNPVIEGDWPAGTYRVYVGALGAPADYTLSVTSVR